MVRNHAVGGRYESIGLVGTRVGDDDFQDGWHGIHRTKVLRQ